LYNTARDLREWGKRPLLLAGIFVLLVAGLLSFFAEYLGIPFASGSFQEKESWKILLFFSLILWGGREYFLRQSMKKERGENSRLKEEKEFLCRRHDEESIFRKRFSALFNRADMGILFLSPRGIIREYNPRAKEILGFPGKDLFLSQIADLGNNAYFKDAFSKARESGMGEFQGEIPEERGRKGVYLRCRFIRIESNRPQKEFCCILEDLTREYRMRRDLEESEDFLNMVINFLPVGLLFVDESTNIVCRANEYIMRCLGRGEKLFSERPYNEVIEHVPLAEKNASSSHATVSRGEALLKAKDGQLLPMLRSSEHIRYRGQELRLESFIDIGERKRAEEALRKSRKALAEANALAHLGSFEIDLFSWEVFAAGELHRMMRFSPGGIQTFGDVLEFVYPGDRERITTLLEGIKEDYSRHNRKKAYSCELRLKRPYQGLGWFLIRARVEAGEDPRIFITMQDITELRLMEKTLRESEKKYRGIFETLQDVYFRCSYGGLFLEISPSIQKLGGYNPEELVGLGMDVFFQDPQERKVLVSRLFQDGSVSDFEFALKARHGEIRHVSLNCHLVRDSAGAVQAYEGMIRDVTERKKQEEQRRILSEVIHQSPLSIAVCSSEGEMLYVNTFFERKTGLSPEDVQGKSLYAYFRENDLLESEKIDRVAEMLRSGTYWSGEMRRRAFGEEAVDHVRLLPLRDPSGKELLGIAFMGEDVTEQKHMEQALVEARETAESASGAKSMFLANMSHEIRTPMNAILGYSQLLQREEGFSPKHKEFLDIIGRSGEYLLALINDILEMSKIEAGRITLHPEPGNLHMLFQDLERMFRIRAPEKGLALSFDIREDVPEWILGDHDKIRQVLVNLLSNAFKFTQTGGITVRLFRGEDPGEDSRIVLVAEVEDTGCGIAPEELEKVFSSFEQTSSGIRHGGGTGLGMAISRRYAQLMGGDVTVESQEGRGSLFRFFFTCFSALPVDQEEEGKRIQGFDFQGREFRVLVVDDNAINRDVLVQMLENAGFVTAQADGGTQAGELFEFWHPHLVLMDYRMEDMDGYEATDRIRQLPGGDVTPVIMVTASALEEKRQEALARGINGFLRKPFRERELFEEMLRHLPLKGVYEESSEKPSEREVSREKASGEEPLSGKILSEKMRADLRDATEIGDEIQLRELLQMILEEHPPLGERLLRMVDTFDYESILRMLREEEEI
jgi:PAS domain S-box-containing protein